MLDEIQFVPSATGIPSQGGRAFFPTTMLWSEIKTLWSIQRPESISDLPPYPKNRSKTQKAFTEREERGGFGESIVIAVFGKGVKTRLAGRRYRLVLDSDACHAIVVSGHWRMLGAKHAKMLPPSEVPVVFIHCKGEEDLRKLAWDLWRQQ
jgi:hypothetical protein